MGRASEGTREEARMRFARIRFAERFRHSAIFCDVAQSRTDPRMTNREHSGRFKIPSALKSNRYGPFIVILSQVSEQTPCETLERIAGKAFDLRSLFRFFGGRFHSEKSVGADIGINGWRAARCALIDASRVILLQF